MSTKDLSYLLVGETSQGRGSVEREEALIHLITIPKSNFKKSTKLKKYCLVYFITT